MAVIAAIAFIITSLFHQAPITKTDAPRRDMLAQKSVVVVDDSIKQKSAARKSTQPGNRSITAPTSQSTKSVMPGSSAPQGIIPVSCSPDQIIGLRLYDLDSTSLGKLGVSIHPDGSIKQVWSASRGTAVSMEEISDGIVRYSFTGFSPASTPDSTRPGAVVYSSKVSDEEAAAKAELDAHVFTPALITDVTGRVLSYSGSISNDFVGPDLTQPRVDKDLMTKQNIHLTKGIYALEELVPVRIRRPKGSLNPKIADYFYIYWYEPTPELLAVLPPEVLQSLENEKAFRARRNSSDPVNSMPAHHALEASIFPNPVSSDLATVKYTLPEAGRVAVSLYDILGQRLKDLSVCVDQGIGTYENRFSLADVPPGMYLLAVTTDAGAQSVQKIIVQR